VEWTGGKPAAWVRSDFLSNVRYYEKVTKPITLHSAPNEKSSVVKTLPVGTKISVVGDYQGYCDSIKDVAYWEKVAEGGWYCDPEATETIWLKSKLPDSAAVCPPIGDCPLNVAENAD